MNAARQTWRRAFTLVEMLVVLAILVLLAGTVFAAMAPAREQARKAACASNLRQIYQGLMMYASDWGGQELTDRASFSALGLPPLGGSANWLDPYLHSRQVWRCPNDPRPVAQYPRSYRMYWADDSAFPGVPPFPDRAALCGPRLPLFDCPHHGWDQGIDSFLIILRWNGQIKGQYVRLPLDSCAD